MSIRLYIKNLQGRSWQLTVCGSDTIYQGKQKYKTISNSNNSDPQWKFGSQVLKNDKTFDFYGFENDDNITSNDRSEGGKKFN